MHRDLVIKHFGYWPYFADAKFTKIAFESVGIIEFSIFYIDAEQNKQATITLKFSGVTNVELNDVLSENVIDELTISKTSPYLITVEACYGFNGNFNCTSVEVLDVRI